MLWDDILMKGPVLRVLELDVVQTFKGFDKAVANDLDLRLAWDGLEITMQDAPGVQLARAMTISSRRGIEASRELVLGLWRQTLLIPYDDYLVVIQRVSELVKIRVWTAYCVSTPSLIYSYAIKAIPVRVSRSRPKTSIPKSTSESGSSGRARV